MIGAALTALLPGASSEAVGTGDANQSPASAAVEFTCRGDVRFTAHFSGETALITTSAGRFVLRRRPSSFGRAYGSRSAAFIQDEDRAALNGLPGGPFRQCRQSGRR